MLIRSFAAGICLAALSTGYAYAADGLKEIWSDGPIPVAQFDYNGDKFCALLLTDGHKEAGLYEYANGRMGIGFFFDNKTTWTSGGDVPVTIDGTPYTITTTLRPDRSGLLASIGPRAEDGKGRDFLHDLYNGSTFVVSAGGAYQASFSLTGSATAITLLHRCGDALTAAYNGSPPGLPMPTAPAPTKQTRQQPGIYEAALYHDHGTVYARGAINDHPVAFVVDSGAGDLSIPRNVAKQLVAEGSLSSDDFIDWRTYVMADGHTSREPRYLLHSVTVGSYTLADIVCSVTNDGPEILLGQSFLGRLSSWSIDNGRHVLVMR